MKNILFFLLAFVLSGCATTKNASEIASLKAKEPLMVSAENYAGLISLYSDIIRIEDTIDNRVKLSEYYFLAKNYESSAYHLENVIKRGNPTSDVLYKQSVNYYFLNKNNIAQTLINRAISMSPNDGRYHNQNGIVLSRAGNYSQAIAEFDKARAYFFDEKKIKNNLAVVYYKQGLYQKAIETILPTYLQNQSDKKTSANVIIIMAKLNDFDYTSSLLKKYYNVDVDDALFIYNSLREAENNLSK